MKTRAEVLAICANLAAQPSIPEFFAARGIKGRRRVAKDCPIARYIKQECGDDPAHGLYTVEIETSDDGRVIITHGQQALADFVSNFDQGKYPDLVDHS